MPMMIPPGQAVTVAVSPGQVTTAGPTPQPKAPAPAPAPRSPFRQAQSPDLVIMPHLEGSQETQEKPT